MASCRITTKSADAPLSASTFAACSGFREARGLMQSAAATIGEINQPVVGSTAWTVGMTVAGGASAAMRRHFANNRSKLEKLPT